MSDQLHSNFSWSLLLGIVDQRVVPAHVPLVLPSGRATSDSDATSCVEEPLTFMAPSPVGLARKIRLLVR